MRRIKGGDREGASGDRHATVTATYLKSVEAGLRHHLVAQSRGAERLALRTLCIGGQQGAARPVTCGKLANTSAYRPKAKYLWRSVKPKIVGHGEPRDILARRGRAVGSKIEAHVAVGSVVVVNWQIREIRDIRLEIRCETQLRAGPRFAA